MPLITLGTAEIMAIIAAEEAAAVAAASLAAEAAAAETIAQTAAAETAAQTAAAEATASQTASQAAGQTAAEEATKQAAQQGLEQIANPNLASQQVQEQAVKQGLEQAANPNLASQQMQEQAVKQGLEQVVDPNQAMAEEMQRQIAEQGINQPPINQPPSNVGNQLANANNGITSDVGGNPTFEAWKNAINSNTANGTIPELPQLSPEVLEASGNGPSAANVINEAMQQPPSTFMNAFSEAGKFAKANPYPTGLAVYGGLYASGALNQKGDAPPPKRTYNNPYTFSPNFQGSSPDPTMYQSKTNYPRYATGGITDLAMGGVSNMPPQTNFANPAASDMGTSQYSMATDPYSGNIANRMADGGVTGSGQMQLNVPINVGGAGGGGGNSLGGGGGYGSYDGTGGPGAGPDGFNNGTFGPNVNNFNSGGGYAPPGGPHGGPQVQRGIGGKGGMGPQLSDVIGPSYKPEIENQRDVSPADVNALYPYKPLQQPQYLPDIVHAPLAEQQPMQRGIGGKGGMTGPQYAQGGIASYKRGGDMDIYDASLRFANMLDNPSRYTPPDTRFQSVDTFRDTNPNTATKLADEAAETRRKAIEQRSYVNTGAKFPTASRRPGQLDLGPVGGERGKYDNQESILAAQGGIMGYNLGGYASGGNPRLLRGPGDGMSDNIPATIADRQPARLADGEFVVPADVVSHLGNGSTEAGAKKLHEMMNSVRKARTGNPKQGKKINPNKFMPKK